CEVAVRPDVLHVRDPEPDEIFSQDTRTLHVRGTVETASELVELSVAVTNGHGCGGPIDGERARIHNPNPGAMSPLPFAIDDIAVAPGSPPRDTRATGKTPIERQGVSIEISCPACPIVQVADIEVAPGALEIATITGSVEPAVDFGLWRVFN